MEHIVGRVPPIADRTYGPQAQHNARGGLGRAGHRLGVRGDGVRKASLYRPSAAAETHIAPACLSHAEGGTGDSELAMSSVGRARGRMLIASVEEHSELRVASLVA